MQFPYSAQKKAKTLIKIVAMFIFVYGLFAMDWPLEGGRYRFGFGSYRKIFLPGIEFPADGSVIKAPQDGEVLFCTSGSDILGSYPLYGNSLLVLSHEASLLSIYSGLQLDTMTNYVKSFRKGDVLGKTTEKPNMHSPASYIFDTKERRFINPLILMPQVHDDKAPFLRSVSLVGEGSELMLDQVKSLKQGKYKLFMDAGDISPAGAQSSCWEIRVLIDGSEKTRIQYDAAWASEGKSYLFGSSGLSETAYYADDGRLIFGPYNLPRGKLIITLICLDYSQNKREQSYSISVF